MDRLYIPVESFKKTRSISGNDQFDQDAETAVEAASRAVDFLTSRRYWLDDEDAVRVYTVTRPSTVVIDDLAELTEIAVRRRNSTEYEVWTEEALDVYFEPRNAAADERPYEILKAGEGRCSFPPDGTVRVTGRFGWPAVPAVVTQATRIIAAKLMARPRDAVFGIVTTGPDSPAVRIARSDPDVAMLLAGLDRDQVLA